MSTMKAVVLDEPGPPNALEIRDLPIPIPGPRQVLIKVAAFGLNRSELAVAAGDAVVPIHQLYRLHEIREAHAEMEAGSATGKIVALTQHASTQGTQDDG